MFTLVQQIFPMLLCDIRLISCVAKFSSQRWRMSTIPVFSVLKHYVPRSGIMKVSLLSLCPELFAVIWQNPRVILEGRSRGQRVHRHRVPKPSGEKFLLKKNKNKICTKNIFTMFTYSKQETLRLDGSSPLWQEMCPSAKGAVLLFQTVKPEQLWFDKILFRSIQALNPHCAVKNPMNTLKNDSFVLKYFNADPVWLADCDWPEAFLSISGSSVALIATGVVQGLVMIRHSPLWNVGQHKISSDCMLFKSGGAKLICTYMLAPALHVIPALKKRQKCNFTSWTVYYGQEYFSFPLCSYNDSHPLF